ncbi:MAG: hypothetical protein CYG60_13755 [Actinobacteria bacterium]|nr:MAG: hypothetical protein CYG60_13755 [Actinomycetota bacterium]
MLEPLTDPRAEVRRSLGILFDDGSVVEMRAFGPSGDILSGYYDDHDILARKAWQLDRCGYQVYVTLNEIGPAFSERVLNETVGKVESTTADRDIVRRRWLLVDVDPVRPSGVSSTNEEKREAYLRSKAVRDYLRGLSWPEPVIANSGGGFHLLYPIDLPNDEKSRELVKGFLRALAYKFDDDQVKIDVSVHNASRLIRLYGTRNAKGANTPERPHRRSRILKVPDEVA